MSAGNNFARYVPTRPGSAVNKGLVTHIGSGGGTTSIVVANAAGNTISGQTALHDNSQNLLAALTASRNSTPVYLNGANAPFNAATVFTNANSAPGKLILANGVIINQPWVIRSNALAVMEGGQNGSTSFSFYPTVILAGNSFAFTLLAM